MFCLLIYRSEIIKMEVKKKEGVDEAAASVKDVSRENLAASGSSGRKVRGEIGFVTQEHGTVSL